MVHALLDLLGEPLLSSTLILPGETEPRTLGWEIKEELDHVVDIVIEAGETPAEPTTVVDWSDGAPEVMRVGAGRPEPVRGVRPARRTPAAAMNRSRTPGRPGTGRSRPQGDRVVERPDTTAWTSPSSRVRDRDRRGRPDQHEDDRA